MAELIVMGAIIVFIVLFLKKRSKTEIFQDRNENGSKRHKPDGIIGKSTFVLTTGKSSVPKTNSSGKMDIEVPLEYEPDMESIEEQEELEQLGLSYEISSDITFKEMMEVVNEVEKVQPQNPVKAGRLLYENENTEWVAQIASSSSDYQKRIVELIDLHLVKLRQNEINQLSDDEFGGFDIGEYIN